MYIPALAGQRLHEAGRESKLGLCHQAYLPTCHSRPWGEEIKQSKNVGLSGSWACGIEPARLREGPCLLM